MKKFLVITGAAAIALSLASATTPASAGNGGAVAAGVVGGLAVGAIIGSQANRNYYNGPGYVEPSYGYRPVYSNCRYERQEVVDAYGNYRIRRVRVCD